MKIAVVDEGVTADYYLEDGQELVFGRSPECDVVLKTAGISRRHFSLTRAGEEVRITDLGSKNGLQLNGTKITNGVLHPDDQLNFGNNASLQANGPAPLSAVEEEAHTPVDEEWGGGVADEQIVINDQPVVEADVAQPQQTESPAQASAVATSAPKKSKLLPVAVALFVLFMAGALALKFGSDSNQKRAGAAPKQRYFTLVDEGVEHLSGRRYGMARGPIARAVTLGSQFGLEIAEVLRDYIKLFEDAGPRLEKLDWERARRLCDEMEEIHPTTDRVQLFSRTEKAWLRKEGSHRATVLKIKRLHREAQLRDSYLLIDKVPKESYLYSVWDDFFAEVRRDYRNDVRIRAQRAFDNNQWNRSKMLFEELKPLVLKSQVAAIDEKIARATVLARQKQAMAMAKGAQRSGNTRRVVQYLSLITEDSPFAAEAALMREQIKGSASFAVALAAYNSGDVATARRDLKMLQTRRARMLEKRIALVLDAINRAERALQSRDPLAAILQWQSVLATETSSANVYHQRAQKNIQHWDSAAVQARSYYTWAQEDFKSGTIARARNWFDKARATDPEGRLGVAELRTMQAEGEMAYNRGLNLYKRDPQAAKPYFEKAKSLLPPNHAKLREIESYLK